MNTSYPPPITSSRWGSRTKRIVVIITALLLGFLIWNLAEILPLVIVASLLSYLLWPLVNFIEGRILVVLPFRARSLAVVFTFIIVLMLFAVVLIVIVPVLINQISELGRSIPQFLESAEAELLRVLSQPISIGGRPILIDGEPIIPIERIQEVTGEHEGANVIQLDNFNIFQAIGTFLGSVGGLTGPAFSVLGGAVTAVINLMFLIIIMFYLMRDGEHFVRQVVNITPESYRGDVRRLLYELGVVWNAYLRGQLILSVSVGLAVYTAALILGLPNAPMLGLIAGVLEFIPNLGPFLALLPAVMFALGSESSTIPFLSGLPFALTVIVVWTGIQNVESFFLVPRVMGGSLNLHPVVVILAVIAGATLSGALGVILAAPFTATARLFGQYLYGKVFDTNPFPDQRYSRVDEPPPHITRLQGMMGEARSQLTHLMGWGSRIIHDRLGNGRAADGRNTGNPPGVQKHEEEMTS